MDKIKNGYVYVSSQTKEVVELLMKGDVDALVGVSVVGLATLLFLGLLLMIVNVWFKARKQKKMLKLKSDELKNISKEQKPVDKYKAFREKHIARSFDKVVQHEADVIQTLDKSFPVQEVGVGDQVILLGVGAMRILQGCIGEVMGLHKKGVWIVKVPKFASDKEKLDTNILYLYRHEFEVTKKKESNVEKANNILKECRSKEIIQKGDYVIVKPDKTEVSALEYIQMNGVVCQVEDVLENTTHPYKLKIPGVCTIILGYTHINAQEKEVELFSKKTKDDAEVQKILDEDEKEKKSVGFCSFKVWENGKLVTDIKKKF